MLFQLKSVIGTESNNEENIFAAILLESPENWILIYVLYTKEFHTFITKIHW